MRYLLCTMSLAALSGCASTAGVFFNRPVVEDSVGETLRTVSLASDRRTVIVKTIEPGRGRFCAEPPPDSATSLASQLDLRVNAKNKAGVEVGVSADDRLKTEVTVLAQHRTPALDGFRIGLFALCQYQLNNDDVPPEVVKELFTQLVADFKENLRTEAHLKQEENKKTEEQAKQEEKKKAEEQARRQAPSAPGAASSPSTAQAPAAPSAPAL